MCAVHSTYFVSQVLRYGLGVKMKKFLVYLLVIVLTVSVGFGIFYLVRDNEIISISSASIYKDAGESFTLDIDHQNKKSYTEITVTSSDDSIVKGEYDAKNGQFKATAVSGGVARINVRTSNAKFRNLWCDVIVGDGTVESPFYISTAEQLASIGMGAGDGEGAYNGSTQFKPEYEKYKSNACYKLVADIDTSTVNNGYWVPLQNFNGRFDGNGLTISNIYIDAVGYKTALGDKADVRHDTNKPAGLFATVGSNGVVYNLKLSNYSAVGTYSDFGVISATNYGTIERIEVKDAYCSVKSAVFGGIAGRNISTEREVIKTDEEGNETQTFERVIARIDRTSVNKLTLGETTTTDASGNTITSVLGVSGTVGGITGVNNGGRVVYSYVRGTVYFGNTTDVTYGGVIGQNFAIKGLHYDETDKTESEFEGAGVRDCYADIVTYFGSAPSATSNIGGAIGVQQDYQNGLFDNDSTQLKVNNYVIGVYYNKDNLNKAESGLTKEFGGIGKFLLDAKTVKFTDDKYIVYGLTTEEMTKPENFVSHTTKEIEFNEDGTSKGVVETNVLWLFDSVWAISADTNDGMPYLNYQLSYIPDDFQTVGVPVVPSTLDDYYYEIEIDYPVSIISGQDGKVRMKVREYYQLVYSPTGIEITWKSSDTAIVSVDEKGKLYGKQAGVATVTATTKSGSSDTVTVIVENIPYKITAPSTIYLYQGEKYSLNNITVSPAPSGNDTVTYSLKDANGNATSLVWIDGTNLCASIDKTGTAKLTIKIADTELTVNVVVVEIADVTLTASTRNITGYLSDMTRTGTITITDDGPVDLTYNYKFVSGAAVADLAFDKNDPSKLNYTIKGVGTATVRVGIATKAYEDKGSVDIYFNIKADETVTLTTSPASVTGYYSSIDKSSSVTVSNSAGTTLSYSATSSNSNVVTVSMNGNSMNYSIKGIGTATATITVTTNHYKGTGYVYFTILEDQPNPPPTEYINLNTNSITINKGSGYTLSASGNYSSKLTWSSDNQSVATVNDNGYVYGVNPGVATIIVKSAYAEARCVVYVETPDTNVVNIYVSPSSATLNVGESKTLTASGNFSSVTWKSSNTSVATVSSGVVKAVATGSATITASAKDSGGTVRATATCSITVTAPTVITLNASSTICYVGDTVTVTASTNTGVTVNWSYTSSLATFTKNGNTLTIKTTKATTIPVTATYGSASASVSIQVKEKDSYSPYIYNKEQLNAVRNHLDKTYYLAASFSVGSWTPIDNFTGTFTTVNGASFTLSGISTSGVSYAGLFGNNMKGNVSNVTISGASLSGTYAGGIAAKVSGGKVSNCKVQSSTITASSYAGGIVGYISSSGVISSCTSSSNTVTATGSSSYVGGIVGYATSASISYCNASGGSAKMGSSGTGYAGGIVGYNTSTSTTYCKVSSSMTINANTSSGCYAGGIAGYTNGSTSYNTVSSCTITGYYAGGIGGALSAYGTVTLKFKEYKSGYRKEDLSESSFYANVRSTAVKTGVTVKGALAGGLFGVINAGVVQDCYARANVQGVSGGSVKAGFAARIYASSAFDNKGGTGSCGLVIYCYSACTFSGSGSAYSITASLVHNYASVGDGSGRAGYCMQYVFDNDKDGGATYNSGSNIFSSDKVKAKKSSGEMQSSSTYTGKGFSSSYWSLSGYPTLHSER